jgi:hypothetical protein
MFFLTTLSFFLIDSHLEKVKSYYNMWHANALKVHSAIVDISGEEKSQGDKGTKPITIRIAFDNLARKEFINWDWPGQASGVWSRGPKSLTYMEPDGGIINIVNPEQKPLPFIRPFDIRYLPFASNGSLKYGLVTNDLWKEVEMTLGSKSVFQVVEHTDRITCEFIRKNLKSRYDDQYRMEADFTSNSTPNITRITYWVMRKNKAEWYEVSSSKLKYESHNGVFVPVDIVSSDSFTKSEVKLKLKWKKVNEPLNETEFDVKNFPIQKKTLLIDSRISKEKPIILDTIEPTLPISTPITERSQFSSKTKILMFFFVTICLITVCYIIFRRNQSITAISNNAKDNLE